MSIEEYMVGKDTETAIEALERFEMFIKIYFTDDSEHEFTVNYSSKVTEDNLLKIESKFNFSFPPSYKNFVLEKGIIRIGEMGIPLMEIESIGTLYSKLQYEWDETFNDIEESHKEELEKSKELITFSYGEDEQSNWYYCFDKRSLNQDTGEMNIYSFCQDYWFFEEEERCEGRCFDNHFIELINEKIDYIVNEY